ncbi:hypothetical protein [Leptolyngbya sp. NIES-2104]|uniref:hypothetical protein n=1 Tax=Leptolyngbya sp. NIES-2104 TaxID=1552121 RepID=UPI00073EC2CA|nr:hypothetical protein [Leptolyngbya sp. NIES-2104]
MPKFRKKNYDVQVIRFHSVELAGERGAFGSRFASLLALLAKWFSPQFVLPTINAMEQVDSHSYDV